MRRPGRLAWLTHDLTHRGVTAWALAALLLGFYFGLYLTAETREFLAWLGVVRAPDALRLPGPRAWALCALVGGLTALLRGRLQRREDGLDVLDAAGRRAALALGMKAAALTAATLYTARGFAAVLEPAEHHGRHLLPSPGASWPAWILAPTLALSLGGAAASVALAWPLRRDRGALLRRLSLTLSLAAVALLAVLYGTHLLDPASPLARYGRDHGYATVGDLLADSSLRAWNEDTQADDIEPNVEIFRAELGLTDEEIVRVPALFESERSCNRLALSLIPGTVNMAVGTRADGGPTDLLIADPFLRGSGEGQDEDPLIAAVEALLPASAAPRWVDDWDIYHLAWGEVHCGSNLRRIETGSWWEDAAHLMEVTP